MKKILRIFSVLILAVAAFFYIQQNNVANVPSLETGNITTGIDLTNCISYFDGCNNCSVKDGKPDACTMMYCETPSEPKCNQYGGIVQDEQYIVRHESRSNEPGEDIFVSDLSGNLIFSLTGLAPQYFYALVQGYMILDIGTAASSRTFALYNISTQQKVFEENYHDALVISGTTISFAFRVWSEYDTSVPKPQNAPACTGINNGYIQFKTLDILTQKITSTEPLLCSYFE